MTLSKISVLQGVNVAAITPFDKTGDLNFGATFELIDYLSAARVGGIALFTAVGEYPAFTTDDRARLTYLAVKRSRVPLLVGAGSATLDQSLALARGARDAGAAAVLLPPPLLCDYDADDIREFYSQFDAQFGGALPILVSGDLPAGTASPLLETGRFIAIGDQIAGEAQLVDNDRLFVHARSAGIGVISAAACAVPELTMALNRAILEGNEEKVRRLDGIRQELVGWLERFPKSVGVKTAVTVRGIQTGALTVPLSIDRHKCLGQFKEWLKDWLPATRKIAANG